MSTSKNIEGGRFYSGWHKSPIIIFNLIALLYLLVLASGAGISGDEDVNYRFGSYVVDYFLGNPEGAEALSREVRGPDYAYQYTYDLPIEILDRIFDFDDPHQARHYWSAIIGWGIILLITLLGRQYFDDWTGIIAGTLLLISPRFVGHAANNTRDIPFAFAYILGAYAIFKFALRYKDPNWRTTLVCMLLFGASMNSRIGAFILFPFLGFITILNIWYVRKGKMFQRKYWPNYSKLIFHMGVILVGSYAMMIIFWPYGQQDPLNNPLKTFKMFSDLQIGLRQLFEGNNVSSLQLPWYYTLKYIAISTPHVFQLGFLMALTYLFKKRKRSRKVIYFSLVALATLPLLYLIYKGSNVFGGWRHSTFVYPPMTLLAAIGWRYTYKLIKGKTNRYLYIGVGVVLMSLPIFHVIRNYPVHYVYFNELSGGVKAAYGNYEMDYYLHSIKPGCDWLIDQGIVNDVDSLLIASNHRYSADYYNRNFEKVNILYTRYYERLKKEWDYAVYVNVYIDQPEIRNGVFPPTGTIHTIDVEGKPVCAVVKNPSNAAVGYDADLQAKNYRRAVQKLRAYYAVDQRNFECNMNLAIGYQGLGNRDSLNFFLQKAKEINPQRFALYTQPRK